MSKAKTKLTTVNVIEDTYKQFRINVIEVDGVNFQKLVNRSLDLYNTNEDFRNLIDNHDVLAISGSRF
jgi:transketolase N-terminal domain/subunit